MSDIVEILQRRAGGNFKDVRRILPVHPTLKFSTVTRGTRTGIAVHHSAGSREATPGAIANFHVADRGWAGIGYHFVIRLGMILYAGDIDTARAHVAAKNHLLVGACITGDYTEIAPRSEDIQALRILVGALDEYFGRELPVKGHDDWALKGHKTECPGAFETIAPHIRAGGPPAPPADRPIDFRKVAYAVEVGIRSMETDELYAEADFIREQYLTDAIRRRAQQVGG